MTDIKHQQVVFTIEHPVHEYIDLRVRSEILKFLLAVNKIPGVSMTLDEIE